MEQLEHIILVIKNVSYDVDIREKLGECKFEHYNNDKDDSILIKEYKEVKKSLDNENSFLYNLIQSRNEQQIQKFLDYCLEKCIIEEKVEFMLMVAVLFPDLVKESYENQVSKLMKQLTYVKVPQENLSGCSDHENLWGYSYPYKGSFCLLERFEKVFKHSTTLCYVPLPGLCIYPESDSNGYFRRFINFLFPNDLSPFAKFIINHPSEILPSRASYRETFKSPAFQAIAKFKWHAFGWWRFLVVLFLRLIYFGLFSAMVSTKNKQLMIACIIYGTITIIFFELRYTYVFMKNGYYWDNNQHIVFRIIKFFRFLNFPSIYIGLVAISLSVFTTIINLSFSKTFMQSLSIFFLWIDLIRLLSVFKSFGIVILVIAHTIRKTFWLLLISVIILAAIAHSFLVFASDNPEIGGDFNNLGGTFNNVWSWFLNDYSSISNWMESIHGWSLSFTAIKIAVSLIMSVILINTMIALVNNIYTDLNERVNDEWCFLRSQAEVVCELFCMSPKERQNRDYFPWIIIYEAFTEDVEKWPQKLEDDKIPIFTEGKLTNHVEE